MKNTSFVIIVLLFGLNIYLGDKAIKNKYNEVSLKDSINVLNANLTTLKAVKNDLYNYSSDLEKICEKYKSSRDAKYEYHLRTKTIIE